MINLNMFKNPVTPNATQIVELKTRVMDVLNSVVNLKNAIDSNDDTRVFRYAGEFSNTMRRYIEHASSIGQTQQTINQSMQYIFGINWSIQKNEIDNAGNDFVALRDFIRNNRDAFTLSLSETDGNIFTIDSGTKTQLVPLVNAAFAHVEQ